MKIRKPDRDALLLKLHSAVLDPESWQEITEQICRMVSAEKATLFSLAPDTKFTWQSAVDMDPQAFVEYAHGYVHEDVWLKKGLESSRTGVVRTGEQLLGRGEFLDTAFFNEYLKRYDIDRFLNVVLMGPPQAGQPPGLVLSLYRGVGNSEFGIREVSLLQSLAPHLVVAARNCVSASRMLATSHALASAVDSLSVALFVLGVDLKIVSANSVAQQMLREGLLIRAIQNRILPGSKLRNPLVLERILVEAALGRSHSSVLESEAKSQRNLVFTAPISPQMKSASRWTPSARALLWVIDSVTESPWGESFGKLFELTSAETRLIRQFKATEDLGMAASALNRSVHTVRAQMKSILRKTGSRSQGQLLALISRFSLIRGDVKSERYP